jgi:hypothetical protein
VRLDLPHLEIHAGYPNQRKRNVNGPGHSWPRLGQNTALALRVRRGAIADKEWELVTAGFARRTDGSRHASATKPNVRSNTHLGLSRIGGSRQGYVRAFIVGSAQVLALLITGPHIEV